ncbi:hypothetical protein MSG28_005255 [Choristoneura fumiferana]|uniref:Uncharacterized protein n=1 Tax=Choristoneura fumiferana TaxID=7141 RepID=A0ACC0JQJ6_CHOFU|nr:hypothetical protein MSG28_005255 [Choristoneura fumiferana]
MVRFWWMFVLFAKTASASDNELPDSEPGKESRFLPLFEVKRFDSRPGLGPGGLPPLTTVPIAGERCSQRLESALDQLKRRKRNQPKTLDTPLVSLSSLSAVVIAWDNALSDWSQLWTLDTSLSTVAFSGNKRSGWNQSWTNSIDERVSKSIHLVGHLDTPLVSLSSVTTVSMAENDSAAEVSSGSAEATK